MKLVTGNSNLKLAKSISDYVGVDLSKCEVKRFADKEIFVETVSYTHLTLPTNREV